MAQIINTAHCMLVGLNCLTGKEREKVHNEWVERFQEHEAFWVDVKENQGVQEISRAVMDQIQAQEIESLMGVTLLVAVFFDLSREPDTQLISQAIQVPDTLNRILGCNTPLTMEFGSLARMQFSDREGMRQRISQVVALGNDRNVSGERHLFLVATMPLVRDEDDPSWKSAVVCLDILRREAAPADMFTLDSPNGSVGFLRYGEYDEQKLNWLTAEQNRLLTALGTGGEMELREAVSVALSKIESEIEEQYVVDGRMQPIHPDMKVDGFLARNAAKKKKNSKYEAARNSTWSAMELTARRLRDTIRGDYQNRIQRAGEYLAEFIQRAGVGVDLEADSARMSDLLKPEKSNLMEPMAPELAYSEQGCTGEIGDYFKAIRRWTARKVREEFAAALLEAYRQVDPAVYVNKRAVLIKEKNSVDNRLKNLIGRGKLIGHAATGTPLPMSCFNPILPGGISCRWVLCRTGADMAELDNRCTGTPTTVYYIDEKYGCLKLVDNAPIKAIQALLFDCTDERLKDLIR